MEKAGQALLTYQFIAWLDYFTKFREYKTNIGPEIDNFGDEFSENESLFEGNNGSETSTASQYNILDMEDSLTSPPSKERVKTIANRKRRRKAVRVDRVKMETELMKNFNEWLARNDSMGTLLAANDPTDCFLNSLGADIR